MAARFAAIFVTEIGDIGRFRSPEALCSWAGLTPRHRESDTKVVRGKITKQGSKLVRWAALEAIVRYHGGPPLRDHFHRIAERRGTNKARIATARRLLTLVYYGLRDGEIRCLQQPVAASSSDTTQATRKRHDSHPGGDVDELIESLRVVAQPHHALRGGQMPGNRATTQHDTLVRNPTQHHEPTTAATTNRTHASAHA